MHIKSPAFRNHGPIPQRFSCEGADISPPLFIDAIGMKARSLAIVVQDRDAPRGAFVHWVVYNLPPTTEELPENVTRATLPPGAQLGTNGFERVGWAGPCPRLGGRKHHYAFTLYALDVALPDLSAPTRDELLQAMQGHIVAEAELVGTYGAEERRAEAR